MSNVEKYTFWRLALALPLALLLAACGTGQTAVVPPATATSAPASASPVVPAVTGAASTSTAAPAVAAATAAPTILAPTNTAPASTVQPTGPAATATPDPAVAAVLAYLDARAQANVTAVTNLSCKTWKSKAVTEAVSFRSMKARLVEVNCLVHGSARRLNL